MENIEGNYKIEIYKDYREFYMGDFFIAEIIDNKGNKFCIGGNYNDIFYMIGDHLSTVFKIKIPTWKRWIIKLFNLP